MGGGTFSQGGEAAQFKGLSPRGRGNLFRLVVSPPDVRSIPAWAGEPAAVSPNGISARVYPRVGGGTFSQGGEAAQFKGLSPRGRGNLFRLVVSPPDVRSIPAWAGEPAAVSPNGISARVYPRVGGGTIRVSRLIGVRPGLSPRGRGNPYRFNITFIQIRSIPAWAGEPSRPSISYGRATVYPRVGGGTYRINYEVSVNYGLSPRGRGNLHPRVLLHRV